MSEVKEFPEGMTPIGNEPFTFKCHPGVSCFTVCCSKVDLMLYPYDVIRLKNNLGISSSEFLERHARFVEGNNPFFPSVMLKLKDEGKGDCPFLSSDGCTVYEDRPTDCRTYPLERAVDREGVKGRRKDFYFLVRHDYCKGHYEKESQTVRQWTRNQRLEQYNTYNELWTEMDTFFRTNPWKGEGAWGPGQQMAFMACYNIDMFRQFCSDNHVIERFKLSRDRRRAIDAEDSELLKFAFDWIRHINKVSGSLVAR